MVYYVVARLNQRGKDFCQPLHGVSRLLTLAWHIQHCRIPFVIHSPDVRQLRDAGLDYAAYQSLLVCTGHAASQ